MPRELPTGTVTFVFTTDPLLTSARQRGGELQLWDVVAIALGELELPQTEP